MPPVDERVLIIEDDPAIAHLEQAVLQRAGYHTLHAGTGGEGLAAARTFRPSVVLLDVGLPDVSGLAVCTALAQTSDAYILMVTGQTQESDKLAALGLGADDYIAKPFSPSELVARIRSFLRRRERDRARGAGSTLAIGDTILIRDRHTVERGSRSTVLTTLEFRLLWFLGGAEGRLLTRAQILERVWNDVSGVPTRVVDVHVAALRKKLAEIAAPLRISSVRGIGYRLDVS
jgi:DNA-binding response OmpR family regulator